MAIEKRISLKLDSSGLKKQIDDVRKSLDSVNKSLPSGKKDPFAPMQKSAPKARKALIDYAGALENSERILKQSVGTNSLVEKQILKHDTALRRLNKAYDEGRIDVSQYETALENANMAHTKNVAGLSEVDKQIRTTSGGFRMMRGSLAGLSYQFQDIAVQAQMGTNWATIIGQQGPQIASYFGAWGAVLGVITAVGAAVGGTALTAFLDLEDAGDKLEKQMDSLNGVMEKTADGAYIFSSAIIDLKKNSDTLSDIKIALAIVDAQKAIETANKGIGDTVTDLGSNFRNFFNVVGGDYLEDLERLKLAGIDVEQVLSGVLRASDVGGRYVTSSSINDLRNLVIQLSDDFEISEQQAASFVSSLSRIGDSATAEDFRAVQDSLAGVINQLLNGDLSSAQGDFVVIANDIAEMASKGATAADIMDRLTTRVDRVAVAFTRAFTENQQSVAQLNSEFDTTSSLIIAINSEYERLNELQLANDSVSSERARNQARENAIRLIADEIEGLDTYAERQSVVNELIRRSSVLKKEDGEQAMALAQASNYVYENEIKSLVELAKNGEAVKEIFDQGAQSYADSVGSYNESLEGLVTGTFSRLEDSIVDFAVRGEGTFRDFTNAVLEDLLRIQIQQQLAGISSFLTGGGAEASAKGNVYSAGGIQPYAKGGITGMVNTVQSTPKYFANGGGLLGESAQSEAILPLTRTSGGDLGVKAMSGSSATVINFNITNEQGVESEVTGTTQNSDGSLTVDLVAKMVNKSIASGKTDNVMKSRYGLKRRGV